MSAPEVIKNDGAELAIFREAPSLDGAKTAALGAFACEAPEAGARLIREAMAQLKVEGFGAVLGPMDGSTWAKHRLVVESDGRPPFLMEPENPAHFAEAFEQSGLKVVSRYVSAVRPADVAVSASVAPAGIRLRDFNPGKAEEELTRIHALSLEAFAANSFYQPISLEAFLGSYRPVLKAVDPELVLMAEDDAGELKAFLFAIPNLVEGRKPTSVILKTYASRVKGGGSMLANAFHERASKRGYSDVIHALMHESNLSATHSGNTGGHVFRRYALWGGQL
ncbi:MAG: hypothetical protein EON61_00050 [Alphaproteobacteria bacterium]|nr:MAG: hypothetical protein EON61_00050 [Alphaproteobacteria bacterium]